MMLVSVMFDRAVTICICTIWLSISPVSAVSSMVWFCSSTIISWRKSSIERSYPLLLAVFTSAVLALDAALVEL